MDEDLQKICTEYLSSVTVAQQQDIVLTTVNQGDSLSSIYMVTITTMSLNIIKL